MTRAQPHLDNGNIIPYGGNILDHITVACKSCYINQLEVNQKYKEYSVSAARII